MAKENHFIREYDKVRKIVKNWFLYGCYTKEEYMHKLGISARTYDLEVNRLATYIDERYFQDKRNNRKKEMGFIYDKFQDDNYFFNTYKICAYTQKYMRIHFAILQVLYREKKKGTLSCSLVEIVNMINELDAANMDDDIMKDASDMRIADTDSKEILRKLNDLLQLEVIETIETDGKKRYRLADNPLDRFETDELKDIYYAAGVYASRSYCATPAMFLKEQIAYYLKHERRVEDALSDICIYQYHFLQNILNDNIVYSIKEAIRRNCLIEIIKYKKEPLRFIPYKLMTEYWYGRQYVCGMEAGSREPHYIRIDHIQSIKILSEKFSEEVYSEKENVFEHTWCATIAGEKRKLVEIDFYTNEENDAEIRGMLTADKRAGTVKEVEPYHIFYYVEVADPMEMKPWIRKFGAAARVRKSTCHRIAEELEEEWKEALRKYGVISEE